MSRARDTKDMIQEHLGARSVSDAATVAIQKLTNGDVLSPAQWSAFHDLISNREFVLEDRGHRSTAKSDSYKFPSPGPDRLGKRMPLRIRAWALSGFNWGALPRVQP